MLQLMLAWFCPVTCIRSLIKKRQAEDSTYSADPGPSGSTATSANPTSLAPSCDALMMLAAD
jgi:hypothetical protein